MADQNPNELQKDGEKKKKIPSISKIKEPKKLQTKHKEIINQEDIMETKKKLITPQKSMGNKSSEKIKTSKQFRPYHDACTSECLNYLSILFTDYIRHFTENFMKTYTSFGRYDIGDVPIRTDKFMSEAHKKLYEKAKELMTAEYFQKKDLYLRCPREALLKHPKEIHEFIPAEPYKTLNEIFIPIENCIKDAYGKHADFMQTPDYTDKANAVLQRIKEKVIFMQNEGHWSKDNGRVNTFLKLGAPPSDVKKLMEVLEFPDRCTKLEAAYWFLIEYFDFKCYHNFMEDLFHRKLVRYQHSHLITYLTQLKVEFEEKHKQSAENRQKQGTTNKEAIKDVKKGEKKKKNM